MGCNLFVVMFATGIRQWQQGVEREKTASRERWIYATFIICLKNVIVVWTKTLK